MRAFRAPLLTLFLVLAASPAWADQAALGVSVSSYSAQIQADYDIDRHIGFQGGIGEMLFMDDFSFSLGGRFYFVPKKVTPYVGLVYRAFEDRDRYYDDRWHEHGQLFGPTIGVRGKKWRGIGGFVQLELLQHGPDDDDGYDDHHHDGWHPALAAGVQYWF